MRLAALTMLLAASMLAAGCGSSEPKDNGVSAKTADEILLDAVAAAKNASSVHVAGAGKQGDSSIGLNLYIVAGKGGKGHLNVNGLSFDLVRVGPTAYFKGDAKFWANAGGGPAAAQLFKGKWLSQPSGTGELASFTSLTDPAKLFDGMLGSHGTLTKGDESTIDGQPVIALIDSSKQSILYVSTTGEPFPIKLVGTGGKGTIAFSQWNEKFDIDAPAGSVAIDKLQAG
jgi:hypothetical protein